MNLGFIKAGFSRPEKPAFFDRYLSWLSSKKNAGMSWMERNNEIRQDPGLLLEGCSAIISLAYPYPAKKPFTADGCCVARYSLPHQEDYHRRLRKLCNSLCDMIKEYFPECSTRICIDSAPILERSYAYSAGIGFIGKNNMVIIPGYGSFFYLAEILTTAPIVLTEEKPVKNLCGSCTLCLDACPSGALERAYSIDASRCLSYLTVEDKEPLTREQGKKAGRCFFGCDVCQEVCPFNKKEETKDFSLPSAKDILEMDNDFFREKYGVSALYRTGLEKIKSNIRAVTLD